MNPKQKSVIFAALLLFVFMCVFPPWKSVSFKDDRKISKPIGYGLVFSPPENASEIDFPRLFVQWALIGVAGFALFSLLKPQPVANVVLPEGVGVWNRDDKNWSGGHIQIWDTKTWKLERKLVKSIESSINTLKYSPDGRLLASGGNDREVLLWDAYKGKLVKKLKGHSYWIFSLDFHPDGETLASASSKGPIMAMRGELILWGPFGYGY